MITTKSKTVVHNTSSLGSRKTTLATLGSDMSRGLKRPSPVPILPKPTVISMNQAMGQPTKIFVNQSPSPRIVLRSPAPPLTPAIPNKMIRLTSGANIANSGGVRPMTKITFPIPAEFKMGKVFAKSQRKN